MSVLAGYAGTYLASTVAPSGATFSGDSTTLASSISTLTTYEFLQTKTKTKKKTKKEKSKTMRSGKG